MGEIIMKLLLTTIFGVMILGAASPQSDRDGGKLAPVPEIRFEAVDVYVDSDVKMLAAYQFELSDEASRIKIVGVEGGEHKAFKRPPYYDSEALSKNRIIIADFQTDTDLPKGKTRVARVHIQITGSGEPEYKLKLIAAASGDGKKIPATITFSMGGK